MKSRRNRSRRSKTQGGKRKDRRSKTQGGKRSKSRRSRKQRRN